ncbi:MAG: secretion system protein [Victivallaceae bacterium]
MGLSSSSSSSDGASLIRQQVLSSTPNINPDAKLSANEVQQMQKVKSGETSSMEADAASVSKSSRGVSEERKMVEGFEVTEMESEPQASNVAKGKEMKALGLSGTSSMESLSSVSAISLKEIEAIVKGAAGQKTETMISETPNLPAPKVVPRKEVTEIAMALAQALSSLTDSTIEAIKNYADTDKQAQEMNKTSLASSQATIEEQRTEFQKMKEVEGKQQDSKTMDTVNAVCIAISVVITVISIIAAIFTCGAGLIGLAGAGAAAGAAGGTAAATATAAAVTATATSVATTTASQVTMQAVIQAVKQAVVEAVKQAIKEGIKASVKATIKAVIKNVVKALMKQMSKIFQMGKSLIKEAFPKLAKVFEAVGNKWVGLAVGTVIAVPQLVKGIFGVQLSEAQNQLADIQKEVGALSAQSEMMKMFTMFWQQASKIASKQTGDTSQMQDQIVKTFGQMNKAYRSIGQGLAAAV